MGPGSILIRFEGFVLSPPRAGTPSDKGFVSLGSGFVNRALLPMVGLPFADGATEIQLYAESIDYE